MECVKLIKNAKAKLLGFACIINRSNKNSLKIKDEIISQVELLIPTYKKNNLPLFLKKRKIIKPGSRYIK